MATASNISETNQKHPAAHPLFTEWKDRHRFLTHSDEPGNSEGIDFEQVTISTFIQFHQLTIDLPEFLLSLVILVINSGNLSVENIIFLQVRHVT